MEVYNKEIFCRTMIVNEALFGQTEDQLRMMMKEVDTELNFDFHNFYLCLTGLPKKYYTSDLKLNRQDFVRIFEAFILRIQAQARQAAVEMMHAVINYDGSKQIVFLIKKGAKTESEILMFTRQIMETLEAEYQKDERYLQSSLANFTVLSELISDYSTLAAAFEKLRKLSRLAYVDMRPAVIRSQDIPQGKGDWNRIRELLEQIELLLFDKNVRKLELAVHELFIKEVKPSFNFDLGYAVINDLNRLTMKLKDQLNLTQSSASLLFHLDRYFSVEETEKAVLEQLRQIHQEAAADYQRMSPVTQQAIAWIKQNYTEEIGLQETADYLGMAPAYVSRTFSRDLKISLSAYITRLRIERAKLLLMETNMRIAEIAVSVGIVNRDYFSVLFKKNTGMRPQAYRDCYRQ